MKRRHGINSARGDAILRASNMEHDMSEPGPASPTISTATLAGGCFWCLEAAFGALNGVLSVRSGYMGGRRVQPTYEQVCTGVTGHAEVVRIEYDPTLIGFRDLLEVFFTVHDPTTLNRQGNDVGTQYRSAIFWHDQDQRSEAEAMIAELGASGAFSAPIVTELAEATTFWPAETYHDDYYARNPNQPYCMFVVAPKVMKVRAKFAAKLK
jgi:peptide-methionine (S)-S-oxide reductase